MPFVKRDAEGSITAVFQEREAADLEEIHPDSPELSDFFYRGDGGTEQRHQWLEADLALARVLEDLIDLLIEKGYIRFTDFPEAAQQKLLTRRGLRKEFAYVENLFPGDDDFGGESGDGGGFL